MNICSFNYLPLLCYFLLNLNQNFMPQGNQTGPMGQGPRTGRRLGLCSGYDSPGYTKGFGNGKERENGRGMKLGRGMRQGIGSGFRNAFRGFSQMSSLSKQDELALLKSQADELKRSQDAILKKLSELEKNND